MDGPTRRPWASPELIVLVRGAPEEAVLDACKVATAGHTGHGLFFASCHIFDGCDNDCLTHLAS